MTWAATDRYQLVPARGGLAFVHDLLNTLSAGRPRAADLLGDIGVAQQWLDGALAQWCSETGIPQAAIKLGENDLEGLRDLRRDVSSYIGSDRIDPGPLLSRPTAVATRLGEDGVAVLEPRGEGWRRVASIVLLEIFRAQQADDLRRLKTCRNDRCHVAFYDRSRNNSGVWHDTRVCGNAVNLRASRARRRRSSAIDDGADRSKDSID